MPEYWMLTWPIAGRTAQVAKLCEATGWDGLLITDTQCLAAEAMVQLSMCVAATERIKLGTGVTNRSPAILQCWRPHSARCKRNRAAHAARNREGRFVARPHRKVGRDGGGARGIPRQRTSYLRG